MKRLLLLLAMMVFKSAAASDLDFTLVNDTSRSFEAVYISAADNPDWDGNVLGKGGVLAPGAKFQVVFAAGAKSPTWDLNVVDDEGLAVRFDKVNLAHANTVTLKTVDGKITAEVE